MTCNSWFLGFKKKHVYLNAIVDVYSFGMVMYEIFSAQKPFQELNKDQVFLKTTQLLKCVMPL